MIFVFVHGGLGILFVIAVVHILCVGHSSVFTRSRRSCTDVDVHSTPGEVGIGSWVLRAVLCTSVLGHQALSHAFLH